MGSGREVGLDIRMEGGPNMGEQTACSQMGSSQGFGGPGWMLAWARGVTALGDKARGHHRPIARSIGRDRCLRWPLGLAGASCFLSREALGGLQRMGALGLEKPTLLCLSWPSQKMHACSFGERKSTLWALTGYLKGQMVGHAIQMAAEILSIPTQGRL